ncbi:MAG: hypothetical protein M0Z32_02625 [Actinomycetota bacterium]|nr:hypothetical protein [Actinomycetota bacterium]MCL6093796.1 hypothetical protein [Actinomycetota bacterium]MDA8166632.1 hypothetical protein [Actinomycetota bacterium]
MNEQVDTVDVVNAVVNTAGVSGRGSIQPSLRRTLSSLLQADFIVLLQKALAHHWHGAAAVHPADREAG